MALKYNFLLFIAFLVYNFPKSVRARALTAPTLTRPLFVKYYKLMRANDLKVEKNLDFTFAEIGGGFPKGELGIMLSLFCIPWPEIT